VGVVGVGVCAGGLVGWCCEWDSGCVQSFKEGIDACIGHV